MEIRDSLWRTIGAPLVFVCAVLAGCALDAESDGKAQETLSAPLLSSVQVTRVSSGGGNEAITTSQTRTTLTHQNPVTITVRETGYACVRSATANGSTATAGVPIAIGNPATGFDVPWTAPSIAGDFVFSVTSTSCNGGPTLRDTITIANSTLPPPPPPSSYCRNINLGGAAYSTPEIGRKPPSVQAVNGRLIITTTNSYYKTPGRIHAIEWNGSPLTNWYPVGTQTTDDGTMLSLPNASGFFMYARLFTPPSTNMIYRTQYLGQGSWSPWVLWRTYLAGYLRGPSGGVKLNGKTYGVGLNADLSVNLRECVP